ncbi:hypothetical protein HRI_002408300 [Hibiscus trionum]|uniref:RING-type E3 ubiquitin transferase n=1 Tax=Hibiscus trionum TaxID=183268 RepID=A0A9W7HZM2_HIBTR|nr:hypothetical protein HRI_002408300 [Hibiscus trionum]
MASEAEAPGVSSLFERHGGDRRGFKFGSFATWPPASKASIEAMPSVEIGESEDGECVVCLEEWKPREVVKEMPCKHKFHDGCIKKWLVIHGACPVCRYKMSADEQDMGKKRDEQRREIWVTFSFSPSRTSEDSNGVPSTDSNNVSPVSSRPDDNHEMEG